MPTLPSPPALPHGWRTTPPGRALYTLLLTPSLLLALLFYTILYALPSRRPSPRWTYRQALTTRFLRLALDAIVDVGWTQSLSLHDADAKKLGERWVVLEPGSARVYTDGGMGVNGVTPQAIGGTWYPAPPVPAPKSGGHDDGLVVLYLHGGLFLWQSGRPDESSFPAGLLTTRLCPPSPRHPHPTRAFVPQYRLAGDARNPTPWPGPLQDALTAWHYLVQTLGITPRRIVLVGDSSGGTIAIALLRALSTRSSGGKEEQDGLPRACLLFSPIVDHIFESSPSAISAHRNAATDYISHRMTAWGAAAVAPPSSGVALNGPDLSPVRHPFATRTPLWVQVGVGEVRVDTVRAFVGAMGRVDGNRVEIVETEGAPHDVFVVRPGWGGVAEGVVERAGEFLRDEGLGRGERLGSGMG